MTISGYKKAIAKLLKAYHKKWDCFGNELLLVLLVNCSKDPVSFDPRVTISKEIIKFFYEETKEKSTIE